MSGARLSLLAEATGLPAAETTTTATEASAKTTTTTESAPKTTAAEGSCSQRNSSESGDQVVLSAGCAAGVVPRVEETGAGGAIQEIRRVPLDGRVALHLPGLLKTSQCVLISASDPTCGPTKLGLGARSSKL